MSTISLHCKNCGSVLEIDEDREIFCCPYCGSKELLNESDEVKKERIRFKAYKEVELGKIDHDLELKKIEYEKDQREKKAVLKIAIPGFICCMAFLVLFLIIGTHFGW